MKIKYDDDYKVNGNPTIVHQHPASFCLVYGHAARWMSIDVLREYAVTRQGNHEHDCTVNKAISIGCRVNINYGCSIKVACKENMYVY